MLNAKIKSREIKKYYLAVVEGILEKQGILTAYLTRGEKKVSVSDTLRENAKPIKTAFKTIKTNNNLSLVEIELLTGRTHQIRAQMAHIGHPLAGDGKYGAKTDAYMTLISYKLRFDFENDAGILNYLCGKEFSLDLSAADTFSTVKL